MTPEQLITYEKLCAMVDRCEIHQLRVWACGVCGQKNRVDACLVIALASQAFCGRCKAVLPYSPPKK